MTILKKSDDSPLLQKNTYLCEGIHGLSNYLQNTCIIICYHPPSQHMETSVDKRLEHGKHPAHTAWKQTELTRWKHKHDKPTHPPWKHSGL